MKESRTHDKWIIVTSIDYIQPKEKQLEETLDTCRKLYNLFLAQQNSFDEYFSKRKQQNQLPRLKKTFTELRNVNAKVLQMVNERLHNNINSLSGKKKQGYKVGQLRYKGEGWYKTFTYNQSGFKLKENDKWLDKIYLSKIGDVPARIHRDIPDSYKVKQVKVKRNGAGEWYAIPCIEPKEEQEVEKPSLEDIDIHRDAVGIDVGITKHVHDTHDLKVGLLDVEEKRRKIKLEQRKLSRKEKGSNNWEEQREKLNKAHKELTRYREDYLHKLSTWYVENYDLIAVEDLDVKSLMEMSSNSENKAHASWSKFTEMLEYKAERAGTHYIEVNPRNTSKECSCCGVQTDKPLWIREHSCPSCGYTADRDYNASWNILQRGLEKLGMGQSEVMPLETATSAENSVVSASRVVERGSPCLKETAKAVK